MVLIILARHAFATHLTELYLWKRDPNLIGACGRCANAYVLEGHQDRWDISDYPSFLQTGYYYMALYGPPETTVTLFASRNYTTERGFLIVIKLDKRPVLIRDLEEFPKNEWVARDPTEEGTGSFRAYYFPHKFFKGSITSVKWRQWWTQLPPT